MLSLIACFKGGVESAESRAAFRLIVTSVSRRLLDGRVLLVIFAALCCVLYAVHTVFIINARYAISFYLHDTVLDRLFKAATVGQLCAEYTSM